MANVSKRRHISDRKQHGLRPAPANRDTSLAKYEYNVNICWYWYYKSSQNPFCYQSSARAVAVCTASDDIVGRIYFRKFSFPTCHGILSSLSETTAFLPVAHTELKARCMYNVKWLNCFFFFFIFGEICLGYGNGFHLFVRQKAAGIDFCALYESLSDK